MEEKSKDSAIDLGKLLLVVWNNIIWVILSAFVLALAAYLVTRLTWKPTYTSEIQLYTIMKSADDESSQATVTTSQINIRRNVAALYVKAIKKSDSLRSMAEKLRAQDEKYAGVTATQLSKYLRVSTDSDASEIIHVKATTYDPDLSYAICEIVGEDAGTMVKDAYIGCTVDVFNHASRARSADKSNAVRNGLIGGLIGLVASVAVILAIYMLDTSLKSGEDLANISGVRYLGDIPDIHESFKGGKYEYQRGYGSSGTSTT
jgi:capsular polysaccharide biosynthesis protein